MIVNQRVIKSIKKDLVNIANIDIYHYLCEKIVIYADLHPHYHPHALCGQCRCRQSKTARQPRYGYFT